MLGTLLNNVGHKKMQSVIAGLECVRESDTLSLYNNFAYKVCINILALRFFLKYLFCFENILCFNCVTWDGISRNGTPVVTILFLTVTHMDSMHVRQSQHQCVAEVYF